MKTKYVDKQESWSGYIKVRENRLKQNTTRDKEGHFIMVKGSLTRKISYIHVPNNSTKIHEAKTGK